MAEETPVVEDADAVRAIGWGLIFTPLCIVKGLDVDDAARIYTRMSPPGTMANRWVATPADEIPDGFWDAYPDDVKAARTYPGPCGNDDTHVHVLVNC